MNEHVARVEAMAEKYTGKRRRRSTVVAGDVSSLHNCRSRVRELEEYVTELEATIEAMKGPRYD